MNVNLRVDLARGKLTQLAFVLALSLGGALGMHAAEAAPLQNPAEIEVSGLGFWDDRQMRLALERLLGESRGVTLGANAVEDAVFLLMASLSGEGYLRPTVETHLTLSDGRSVEFTFDHELTTLLPRPLAATRLELKVTEGVRYVLNDVEVKGSGDAMKAKDARLYFGFGEGFLVSSGDRLYSPSKLKTSAGQLEDELRRLGYGDATVTATATQIDDESGKVSVEVVVVPGARWVIRSIVPPDSIPEGVTLPPLTVGEDEVWHLGWQQDTAQEVRQAFFEAGYPDVLVKVEPVVNPAVAGERTVAVKIAATPGEHVVIGEVRFKGAQRTRQPVLRRRVEAQSGEPLDPRRIEESRYRLSRLGIFRRIDASYEPAQGPVRDVVFRLRERPAWEASMLLGYGSYEQLRGGLELSQVNLWGLAHRSRLQLVQSLKGTKGDYTYTVPELFGEQLDGTVRLFGLQREEAAFDRQEYGGSVMLRRPVPWFGADGRLGYTYQSLRNTDNALSTRAVDESNFKVGSIDAGLTRDRRDNPLRPRRGYRWFGQAELASTNLGGEVDYQRIELGGSYHASWGPGRWIHAGLIHGVVFTMGSTDDGELPVNKRFFPGGDSSIRGFQEGEAAPRGADGSFLGAKTYLLLNLELEQALTKSWSAVLFFDALGEAAELADYPFRERLYSAGFGLRYQTLIGPVRLEYGRNLNPRPGDPAGTLHFSVGFPF